MTLPVYIQRIEKPVICIISNRSDVQWASSERPLSPSRPQASTVYLRRRALSTASPFPVRSCPEGVRCTDIGASPRAYLQPSIQRCVCCHFCRLQAASDEHYRWPPATTSSSLPVRLTLRDSSLADGMLIIHSEQAAQEQMPRLEALRPIDKDVWQLPMDGLLHCAEASRCFW